MRDSTFDHEKVELPACVCIRVGKTDLLLPANDLVVTPYIQINRNWDPEVSGWLTRLAKVSSVFLDVGTMIGYFGVKTFEANPHLNIHLIDPDEKNLRIAYENVKSQQNTWLYNCAISPRDTAGWGIKRDSNNFGNSRIEQVFDINDASTVTTIDLQSAILAVNADLVKIDIQGLEESVLSEISSGNLPKTISIITEVSLPDWKEPAAFFPLLNKFRSQGFRIFLIQGPQLLLEINEVLDENINILLLGDHIDLILDRGERLNL